MAAPVPDRFPADVELAGQQSMRRGFRFDPPTLPPSVVRDWILSRAFGPMTEENPMEGRGPGAFEKAAFEMACSLGVLPRLVSRLGLRLNDEVSPEEAELFWAEYRRNARSTLQLVGLASKVAEIADETETPLVFLKFAALELSGRLAPASRGAVDLDVLVAPERATFFHAQLIARGYRIADAHTYEHQLPALAHPSGALVEVHRMIPGVRVEGRASATASALSEHGLLERVAGLPERCMVPKRDVLIAHALVHGIAQHGHAPRAYPILRMIGDLIDLGVTAPEAGESVRVVAGWIERDLAREEIDAAVGLSRWLEAPDASGRRRESPVEAGRLLAHIVAGTFDERYAASLKIAGFGQAPSDRSPLTQRLSELWGALFLTRGQVEILYGPTRTRWGRALRRLQRPFDLARRFVRHRAGPARVD